MASNKKVRLDSLCLSEDNPRSITSKKFEDMKRSLEEDPWMMELKPIVIDENRVVLAGNQRTKALMDLGYEEVPAEWVVQYKDLDEEQKLKFMIKDNTHFGKWDTPKLLTKKDEKTLQDWGALEPRYISKKKDEKSSLRTYRIEIQSTSPEDRDRAKNLLSENGFQVK